MSRSGYVDDIYQWALIRWRGAVKSAMRGKRGQAFLGEMLAALDAIPAKRLISHDLENLRGVCAIGAVGARRGVAMVDLDPEDRDAIAAMFGVPLALACEVMYENDDSAGYWSNETPEQRWERMRAWAASNINKTDR